MTAIDPLIATRKIRDDYARYLRTSYYFNDPDLRRQFHAALQEDDFLVKGPFIEAAPPFRHGRTIEQLVGANILHQDFRLICGKPLPYDRPLYLHQDQAVSKIAGLNRNVVVATGTGSGKTEAFLISIFEHLLREREAGTLHQPGVRALLLYPMNALANDQLKRLRQLLAHFPEITFGRYTGETKTKTNEALELFRRQFKDDPDFRIGPPANELISRAQILDSPPHLLLTNYAMLEYLLLRPQDTPLFDDETGKHWKFLVLDEAHIYNGATGIEIAMLLRRLKDRVVESGPGRLRCIATSATLGRGRDDYAAVASFASELFGESFEWNPKNEAEQDIVEGTRERTASLRSSWGTAQRSLYLALANAIANDDLPSIQQLQAISTQHAVPVAEVEHAQRIANLEKTHEQNIARFLHGILSGDQRLHLLRDILAEPQSINNVEEHAALDADKETLVKLTELAVRAREADDVLPLLPARYHVFARALEGAFVCLNSQHSAHAIDGQARLRMARHESCPACESYMVEIATCPRCGTVYVVGEEEKNEHVDGKGITKLKHAGINTDDPEAKSAFFVLDDQNQSEDEDDAAISGSIKEDRERLEPFNLCLGCGALWAKDSNKPNCGCPSHTQQVRLYRVELEGKGKGKTHTMKGGLNYCIGCGGRSPGGVVYRFLTGQDAPVAVLSTSLYQLLPPAPDADELPGRGRKLLVFADSRQDAAFFAPYMESTYHQLLRRRLIYKVLSEDEDGRAGTLRLDDIARRLRSAADKAILYSPDQSADERLHLARTWLAQEFVALDSRQGLEGIGLLTFRLVPPNGWQVPTPLMEAPWNLSNDEAFGLFSQLLGTLRQQGVTTYPEGVDPQNSVFEPRNVELYIGEFSESKSNLLGWMPVTQGNRRLSYLTRILEGKGLPEQNAREQGKKTLSEMWRYLTRSPWCGSTSPIVATEHKRFGVVFRLNHKYWEWVPTVGDNSSFYRCDRCHTITSVNIADVCPTNACIGTLVPLSPSDRVLADNHYRTLYSTLETIEIRAQEHTAQWQALKAGEIQDEFVQGRVNVLSCSTTFELGVDVGDLQSVLMRNMPPTTANYLQRAGRAGRRTDSAAVVLTYAQRRSHDLNYYRDPRRMIAGKIPPPVITVTNEKIVRRHIHSVFVAAFLRWAKDTCRREFRSVGDFFVADEGLIAGPELLTQYLETQPEEILTALRRIVPEDLQAELKIENWEWADTLTEAAGNGILDKAVGEVTNDINIYQQLEEEAKNESDYRRAMHYKSVTQTIRSRDLLGFLGKRNVLPAYGFPSDVVEMKTSHVPNVPEAASLELGRDLRIAIAEYAPGGQVVAGKRLWTSGGITRMPNRDFPEHYYAVCKKCNRFNVEKEGPISVCKSCREPLPPGGRLSGKYIVPEYGFIAAREVGKPRERRPNRLYSSRIFFSDYATPDAEPLAELVSIPELSQDSIVTRYRYSRYGKMALVNSGNFGAGFRICDWCGWAEPGQLIAPGAKRQSSRSHINPRNGKDCTGPIRTFDLGHDYITDVLEIQFSGYHAIHQPDNLWLSVLYSLLEGSSEVSGIPRDNLDGTTYFYRQGQPPALVLFDNVPGGAGHVKRLADMLPSVVQVAYDRLQRCSCGPETSCYECLRAYQNQWCHEQLQRGIARDFLAGLLQPERVL